jgi:hypothetical protein
MGLSGINLRCEKLPAALAKSLSSNAPDGGTGATAGAYDTSAHRDAMIVTVNALNDAVTELQARYADLLTFLGK